MIPLPEEEICAVTDDSPVDAAGILLYLRALVGEDSWSRFVEKSGIPQVILTAPQGTPNTELDMWNMRAAQIYEGGSGTLPYGTDVHSLVEGRGQDPFSAYIEHQAEMISILATGGTLMTIGGSTGLGSDLARVQQESFNSLVNQDAKSIANAMSNSVVPKVVKHLFGNVEVKCRFSFVEDAEYSAQDYLDMAIKLNQLGVKIDSEKLREMTQLAFIADAQETWVPKSTEEEKEWTPEEKEQLKKEMEAE